MSAFLILWIVAGLFVGLTKSDMFPGPQDHIIWAILWIVFWPLLWIYEAHI